MVKVQCPKCNRKGSLTKKKTQSKGKTYQYWYIEHHIGNKIKWCYLGKYEKLPEEFKKLIHKDTQTDTQNKRKSENLNLRLVNEKKQGNRRAGSSVWYERRLRKAEAAGSNPVRSTRPSFEKEALPKKLLSSIVE